MKRFKKKLSNLSIYWTASLVMSQRNIRNRIKNNHSIYLIQSFAMSHLGLNNSILTCRKQKLLKMTTAIFSNSFSTTHQKIFSVILQAIKQLTWSKKIKFKNKTSNSNLFQKNLMSSKSLNFNGHNQIPSLYSKTQPIMTPKIEIKHRSQTLVRSYKKIFKR
jgi:hypothetical protein